MADRDPSDKRQSREVRDLKQQGQAALVWGLPNPTTEAAVVGVAGLLFSVSVMVPGPLEIEGGALFAPNAVLTVRIVPFSATPNRAVLSRSTAAPLELKSVTVEAARNPPSCPAS